jgi:hypothetical protein
MMPAEKNQKQNQARGQCRGQRRKKCFHYSRDAMGGINTRSHAFWMMSVFFIKASVQWVSLPLYPRDFSFFRILISQKLDVIVTQPVQIVAEIRPIHWLIINQNGSRRPHSRQQPFASGKSFRM